MDLKYIIIGLLVLALYALSSGAGNAATTPSGNCLQTVQAQYSGQWAEMNTVQRAVVGLRAASCEGGR